MVFEGLFVFFHLFVQWRDPIRSCCRATFWGGKDVRTSSSLKSLDVNGSPKMRQNYGLASWELDTLLGNRCAKSLQLGFFPQKWVFSVRCRSLHLKLATRPKNFNVSSRSRELFDCWCQVSRFSKFSLGVLKLVFVFFLWVLKQKSWLAAAKS